MSDFLYDSIGALITLRQQYASQAEQQYTKEFNDIIQTKCYDKNRIEKLLDALLDFCFDDGILCLYRRLCRYYNQIDAVATAEYIYAYRDTWEEYDELKKKEIYE